MLWLLLAPLLIAGAWLYTVAATRGSFPMLRNKKIVLLIAHPDDEAMFFAPALLQLTKPENGNHVKILCLSSGDADGLGETRKKELVKSGLLLGLRREEDVFVVESPYVVLSNIIRLSIGLLLTGNAHSDFQDSMTATWSADKISELLTKAFAPNAAKTMVDSAPIASINVLLTFDRTGISSHPNHISLYHGARTFIRSLLKPGWAAPIDLYTLTSINIARKYISLVDTVFTMASMVAGKKVAGERPSMLFFLSDPREYRQAQRAMTDAHVSQMRWFRWGWIGLSRYMVVNDLRLETVK